MRPLVNVATVVNFRQSQLFVSLDFQLEMTVR